MKVLETDVLIVGAGPVGLVTALLLRKAGLDALVIERRPTLHQAPQAHVISSRSLEICRAIGMSDGPIRAAGPNPADTIYVRWVDRLAGRDLGVFSMAANPGVLAHMLSVTPTPTTNLSQDQFDSGDLSACAAVAIANGNYTGAVTGSGYSGAIGGIGGGGAYWNGGGWNNLV